MSKDPWEGDDLQPPTLNGWGYVAGNPIGRIDPSGLCGADWGFGAGRRTQECIRLAKLLERQFGVTIYWPRRSDLPAGLDNEITCFCSEYKKEYGSDCEDNPNIVNTETEYKEWRRDEMMALSIAILMYQNEIDYNATRAVLEGVVFVRADKTPWNRPAAGEYASRLAGFGTRPAIILYDSIHNGDGCCFHFPGGTTWTSIHEIAHHVDRFVSDKGLYGSREDFRTIVWGGLDADNPEDGPTDYARENSVEEDLADTITTYLWSRQASDWTAPHIIYRFYQVPFLFTGRRNDRGLTEERNEFVEDLFNALRDEYR